MKKILLSLSILIISTLSCTNDPLDITPNGRITLEDVFQDEKLTEAFVNTVYESIPSYAWTYQAWAFLASITDEAMEPSEYKSVIMSGQWASGSLTPSNNPVNLVGNTGTGTVRYNTYWTGIRNANIFLSYIDNANVPNPANRSRFKAEVQLLRAFYYWELVKQFGAMPLFDKPFDQAFDYTSLKRPTFQECIDFIVKDCEQAIPGLPIRIINETERGRFNKALAYAIKSEALLYNASPLWNPGGDAAKWQAAATASEAALTALTSSGAYALSENYGDYFLNKSDLNTSPKDKETIFERVISHFPGVGLINNIPSKTGMVKVGSCPSQELVDSYEMQATGEPAILGYQDADHLKPIFNPASGYDETNPYKGRDPRFYATIWHNGAQFDNINGLAITLETHTTGSDRLVMFPQGGSKFTSTGYYLRKFLDPKLPASQTQNGDWKKYRLAEIYLNYAEALNELTGPSAAVHAAINVIRKRAGMPDLPASLTKDQMRKRIQNERRVELAIEEHRFWDVRRWKILDQTDKLVTGMKVTKNTNGTFSYERFAAERRSSWQEKFLIFPIPLTDASIIADFRLSQNPGW